jgi:RNA polymerase sigma-70 factor, ECF subfamily
MNTQDLGSAAQTCTPGLPLSQGISLLLPAVRTPDFEIAAPVSAEAAAAAADEADMARLVGGHDAALNDLMERHGERLYQYLVRALQNPEDAADLAQEAFIRVYQHRASFDPRRRFSTWLYSIASNLVRNRYRWRLRHPQVALESLLAAFGGDRSPALAGKSALPSEVLEADERAETVRRAVAGLPEDLRLPLILSEYEERANAEIADILGCTAKAVEMRLYRARKQLRAALAGILEAA